jgi:hypothetical protein
MSFQTLLGPEPPLSGLQTPSFFVNLSIMGNQVSYPYKSPNNIKVVSVLNFPFFKCQTENE